MAGTIGSKIHGAFNPLIQSLPNLQITPVNINNGINASSSTFYRGDNTWQTVTTSGGTVTSVTFTGDGTVLSSTPSSAVTTTGTLTASLMSQSAHYALIGPISGSAANPTFRPLVGSDLPTPSTTTLGGVTEIVAVTHQWINSIDSSGNPQLSQPLFSDISGSLAASQFPTGTQFNTQQGQLTTSASTTSGTMVDTGVTVTITPTSASNKILVRAVCQMSNNSSANAAAQLVRNSTAIGIGTSVGSRTAAGAGWYVNNNNSLAGSIIMEWLDNPATTSATTYKVQYAMIGGSGGISINATSNDTNNSSSIRAASTITVCEVKA